MDLRHSIRGSLTSIILGSGLYAASVQATTLSVVAYNKYLLCDLRQEYDQGDVCYDFVLAYQEHNQSQNNSQGPIPSVDRNSPKKTGDDEKAK